MYLDTFLFLIGAGFAVVLAVLMIYLIVSYNRGRKHAMISQQDIERFNTAAESLFNTYSTSGQPTQNRYMADTLPGKNRVYNDHLDYDTGGRVERGGTGEILDNGERKVSIYKAEQDGFDPGSFADSYTIEREIGGGAMSRTFEVKSVKLENHWFMKYIPKKYGELENEVEILKLLNHAGLPRIIDIFQKNEGNYLVETLVEGFSVKELNQTGVRVNQTMLVDWFIEAAQVLNYLHTMRPTPIYHLDMKPGNIMVTHNNRLVLVDFGIARRFGDDEVSAFTASYAAPEQFRGSSIKKYENLINERFGDIGKVAAVSSREKIGAKTDIYSLGVIMFELATGHLPNQFNSELLYKHVPADLAGIIIKCLAIEPADRCGSTAELLADLNNVKGIKFYTARRMLARKIAAAVASLSFVVSSGSLFGGFVIYNEENASNLFFQPDVISVSLQQSSDVVISKQRPNGNIVYVESNQVVWYEYEDNIARIDGNRVYGINEGETVIRGQHRNKEIELTVRVVLPFDGLTEVSQQYESGRYVSLFSGMSGRARVDGSLSDANFMSPESISASADGSVYLVDAGEIRVISNGVVMSLEIPVDYIKASIVGTFDGDIYFLSEPWQDEDRLFHALCRLSGDNVEAVYLADARYTAVDDFAFGSNGLLYFIERNQGLGEVHLKSLNLYDVNDIKTLATLSAGSSSLAVDDSENIYIGNNELGVIYIYGSGRIEYFAGTEGERAFIDGASPKFYSPQRLEYHSGFLYIWDFNVLRRIEVTAGVAGMCITIAGMAYPGFDSDSYHINTPAENVILPFGSLMDFTVTETGILLTDYKRGIIWEIVH